MNSSIRRSAASVANSRTLMSETGTDAASVASFSRRDGAADGSSSPLSHTSTMLERSHPEARGNRCHVSHEARGQREEHDRKQHGVQSQRESRIKYGGCNRLLDDGDQERQQACKDERGSKHRWQRPAIAYGAAERISYAHCRQEYHNDGLHLAQRAAHVLGHHPQGQDFQGHRHHAGTENDRQDQRDRP